MPREHGRNSVGATLAGFLVLWPVLDRCGAWLGSVRGDHGLLLSASTLAAAIGIERAVSGRPYRDTLRALGLRTPRRCATIGSLVSCAAWLSFCPVFAALAGVRRTRHADLAVSPRARGFAAAELDAALAGA
jgi:hypothetical protein